jgi:hypothetical protein
MMVRGIGRFCGNGSVGFVGFLIFASRAVVFLQDDVYCMLRK